MTRVTVIGGTLLDVLVQLPKRFLRRSIENGAVLLPFGAKIEADNYILSPGGSGANVAVGLHRLGIATTCITGVSTDELGQYLGQLLAKIGVTFDLDSYNGPTSLSVVLRVAGDRTIITTHRDSYGFLTKDLPTDGWLHLGPLPAGSDAFYQRFIAHIISSDQPYSINPSMAEIETRERYFVSLLKSAKILFVNYEEGAKLARLHSKSEPEAVLKALLHLGPTVVCLTAGAKGAYVASQDGMWFAKALVHDDPDELDTTGAGDAFASGFLACFIQSELPEAEKLEQSLAYGIINSGAAVNSPGAQSGLQTASQIQADLDAVTVKRLQ